MAQTTLNYLYNSNLFSNHYLESLVKENPEWKEDVTDAFNRAKKIYNSRTEWNRMGESMLEEFLIRPILKNVLGHHFVPQARVEQNAKRPDYAFFENESDLNEALKNGTDDFYLKAAALGEAKNWKALLDKKIKGVKASFEFQNPSFQIDYYLHVTPVQWGILTNGHHWRLYNKETSYKLDSYYEIDLVTILEKNDIEGFKYFYQFFRLEAFKKDASGKNFLDRVNEGSLAYAKKLGDNLQKNVYETMELLSIGFLSNQDNGLTKNENDLREVQENTLKLLYRLLFIFFAESRKLLDIDNPEYKKLSLESIKYDIANKKDSGERILSVTTDYWNKLNTLFALINEGSESERFKIAKDILYIPAYNGGLFDPKRNPFLHSKKIGDEYIAKAIDLMAREDKEFIDYSTLGTRQLGSIYEGLLEYRLKVATEDLAAVKEKGHEKWLTKKEAEGKKTFFDIKTGEIYLATDKGERKATGSYYTPDYIVKYIVRNTLTPILDERRIAWKEKGLGERPFLHDILSIRVLDPAMGSGHFLVEACEFLANKLVEAWGEARPEDLESEEVAEHDVHWARREVVRHCIFGVDLNPMAVELAKLSLWLETVAANKPLTFLDHHLKVGNSLIGAKVEDLRSLPSKEKKEAAESGKKPLKAPTLWDFTVKKHFEELLAKYGEFAAHPDDDLKSVKQKEQEYDALQKSEINRRLHELANVWISSYFSAAPPPDEYAQMQNEMNPKDFPDWGRWRGRDWFMRAQEIAGEKRFFHWELEFPESFYEKGAPKENPGWDAVVGNPPYLNAWSMTEKMPIERTAINNLFSESELLEGHWDLFVPFIVQANMLTRPMGYHSFIVPNPFLREKYAVHLRKYILSRHYLKSVLSFGETNVFDEVSRQCIVYVMVVGSNQNKVQSIREAISTSPFEYKQTSEVNNSVWLEAYNYQIRVDESYIRGIPTLKKIQEYSDMLGKFLYVNVGATVSSKVPGVFNKKEVIRNVPIGNAKEFFDGADMNRYTIDWKHTWLDYRRNEMSGPRSPEMFESNKLLVRKRTGENERLIATYDDTGIYCDDTVIVCCSYQALEGSTAQMEFEGFEKSNAPLIQTYILSLINSSLLSWIFQNKFATGALQGSYSDVWPQSVRSFPIRRISFTTPPDRRAALVEQAKALYSAFVGAPGAEDLDMINRMDRIDTAANPVNPVNPVHTSISLSAAPDSRKILEFIGVRLSAAPEESDVVHDLLAYLAERMIEMNKVKNAEIKGFLRWLEGEIGARVEELTNKTALKEYYAHDFEGFVSALAKNRKKLKEGYDPTRREPKEKLQGEFNASVGKLAPLLKRIEVTDGLIDQIVYKLYGLTEDEIRIVEESISGNKDLNTKEDTK